MIVTVQSSNRPRSNKVAPALSEMISIKSDSANLIKDFAKQKTTHIGLNHKLREIELASYRKELVSERRILLLLAYAMASVFTALALWVVRFVVLWSTKS